MPKTAWQKPLPEKNGLYWCHLKGKNGYRRTYLAEIDTLGRPYNKVTHPEFDKKGRAVYDIAITVYGAGFIPIHKGRTRQQALKVFGYTDILFWPEPIILPKPPVFHRTKRKAK